MKITKLLYVLFLSRLAYFFLGVEARTCQAGTLDSLITRLDRFGRAIPQEKVYVHMDNTCYWLGDTVWFAAYTRQTNNGLPSGISRILYAELYNQDGYLMERQLIEMKDGRGHGNFVLRPSYYYGGYYELRAYTRWQLNWGKFEHKHSRVVEDWFINKEKETQFYRDYDKLYSRVFPVYDQPKQPGTFDRDMTTRPMRRYFRKDQSKRALQVSFYPEGGQLVSGLPCRMAFEACYSDGEWADGVLRIGDDSAATVHRGRGTITFIPTKALSRKVVFRSNNGDQVSAKLPDVLSAGTSISMNEDSVTWHIGIEATQDMPTANMAVTIMHEGVLRKHYRLKGQHTEIVIEKSSLPEGINQLTVFDDSGRVWADRLFFVRHGKGCQAALKITGLSDYYDPFEQINIEVQSTQPQVGTHISISVRDRYNQEYLYDSGNIMTEMLLASEIKGFVPQPEWYFEADDNLHRQGLDLLLMTQGWRRFNWQDMAVSGRWEIEQPAEKYQILRGRVTKNTDQYDEIVEDLTGNATDSNGEDRHDEVPDEAQLPPKARAKTEQHDHFRFGSLKREVLVHAELVSLENFDRAICEDVTSDNGRFSLVIPHFKGKCIFFLAASDSTKWRRDRRYEWVRMIPSESDRFEKLRYNWKFRDKDPQPLRVTLDFPYPRFVRPYHYYHTIPAPQPEWDSGQAALNDGARLLKEVGVNARRNGLRRFSDANPAFSIDAYEGYNFAYDAGVKITMSMHKRVAENIARAYIGDMGLDYPYYHFTDFKFDKPTEYPSQTGIRLRYGPTYLRRTMGDMTANQDSLYLRGSLSSIPEDGASMPPKELEWNYGFSKIDRYVIYTDYIPRMEGDKRYEGSNLPETNVVLYPFPDGGERVTYRDRRLILPGISVPDQFYHPDYSKRPLPDVKDYRRTLYWNPDLKLDDKGRATIQFYNNCQQTRLSVSADGMTENGQLLTGTNTSYE